MSADKYLQLFEYLSDPITPQEANGNFVFGRKDLKLVEKMGQLYTAGLAEYFLVTGGIGKDSRELAVTGIPEAHYLGVHAVDAGIPGDMIHLEIHAKNGGENVRNGMAVISERGLPHDKLTVVSHATSLRRLAAMMEHENRQAGLTPQTESTIYRVPTNHVFDPTNPVDQMEARDEFNRLIEWPEKGWLGPQPDLPLDLVDFVIDQSTTK